MDQSLTIEASISIHSPHAGRDSVIASSFLAFSDFNPLSPCGERPGLLGTRFYPNKISIHSPHAGRDLLFHSLTNL
mgnify:CR=1 FL=1